MDWIQGFSRTCLALTFHVFEHRSKKQRRRERGMFPPTGHSGAESWVLRIQQADARSSRSQGCAVSCWDRWCWKGSWPCGTAEGLGLFPCKALLGEALLGSWLLFSLGTGWLPLTCWTMQRGWDPGATWLVCMGSTRTTGCVHSHVAVTSWKTSVKSAGNSGGYQGRVKRLSCGVES